MSNVLIVEDDLTIADMLWEVLEADGFIVTGIARTCAEAIDLAERHQTDFAVIDVQLANGDLGTDVAAHLRRTSKIGIIISTGNDIFDTYADCADAVMTKPYRLRDVGSALKILAEVASRGETRLPLPRSFQLLSGARIPELQQSA
jgi:DNA-binding response OmpR family regulator